MSGSAAGMMIREMGAADAGRWDDFVFTCPEATFFHRAGWKAVIEESFGHPCYFLYAEEAGRVRGVLPLAHLNSRLFGNRLVSAAFGVYGGPAGDEIARRLLDASACALADQFKVDHLEYRSRRRLHPDRPVKELYATFRRAIDADPERNLKAIPRKQRAVVRHALKAGLETRIEEDARGVHRLFAESVHRHGTPVFARRYFEALKRVFAADCELMLVRHRGSDVASLLSFYFRDEVLPYYAGGTIAARRCGAHDLMYWDLMRRAGLEGRRLFDFGRSRKGTGPFAFKRNWGFAPETLPYEYRLPADGPMPDLNPDNPRYRTFVALWRRLPRPLADGIGPHLARSLG